MVIGKYFSAFLLTAFLFRLPNAVAQNQPKFKLDVEQEVYKVTVQLKNGDQLIIQFAKATDWKNNLPEITETAAEQYSYLADSFKNPVSQKNLLLKIPEDTGLVTIQWSENDRQAYHRMVYKDEQHFELKTTKDTLIVLKDEGTYKHSIYLSNDSNQNVRQVQYVFVLRDLNDIKDIASQPEKLKLISRQIDSVLQNGPLKKSAEKHLSIHIDNNDGNQKVETKPTFSFGQYVAESLSIGAELFNGNPATAIDIGFGYIDEPNSKNSFFIIVNLSSLWFPGSSLDARNAYDALGIELGGADARSGFLLNKYSMGFQYFFGKNKKAGNEILLPNMFRWYFNFPVDNRFNVGFDLMTNFRAIANHPGTLHVGLGIYLKYSIF